MSHDQFDQAKVELSMKRLIGFAVESNEVEEQFRPARSGPEIFHVWALPFDPLSLKV
jgi:hypothetical protein